MVLHFLYCNSICLIMLQTLNEEERVLYSNRLLQFQLVASVLDPANQVFHVPAFEWSLIPNQKFE